MPIRRMWKPGWNDLCPCASKKKFKDCCRNRLPGFDIGDAYSKAMGEKRNERALIAARADITQYTIWHKTNTAPVISRSDAALELLRIDVNALGDYVGRLSSLYFRNELSDDWLGTLDALRTNIQHPWWYKKIAYYRAIFQKAIKHDRVAARQELAKAGPIDKNEADLDLLHLYVDLEFDDQSFGTRIEILDRILEVGSERQNQLQYRVAKAVQYFMIGDLRTAEQQLEATLRWVQEAEQVEALGAYEKHLYGRLKQLLGNLKHDKKMQMDSAAHFQALLLEDYWTDKGKADLHREIGDSYRYAREWQLAENAYRDAIALGGSQLDTVHLAECLLYQKKIEYAAGEIDKVKQESMPRWEFEDFSFAYAAIAIWSGKADRLTEARAFLEGLQTKEPLFNERRLKLLLRVTQTLASGKISNEAKAESTPEGGIATVSDFVMLQPNIAGFGININAIINYFSRKKPKTPAS